MLNAEGNLNSAFIIHFSIQHSAFSNCHERCSRHRQTSRADVARRRRRGAARDRSPRVGHTGTLDPLATGVLPLVIGQATRLASFMSGADKEYVARIRFGVGDADLRRGADRVSSPLATGRRCGRGCRP